jgi:hypothetical protein
MAWGFAPVIIAIILSRYLAQETAVYIGLGAGILFSGYNLIRSASLQLLLFVSTLVLLLFAVASLFLPHIPYTFFPFILELAVLIPVFLLFGRQLYARACLAGADGKNRLSKSIIATRVSTRVVMLITAVHLTVIFLLELLQVNTPTIRYMLYRMSPLLVFVLSILFNQWGIIYFNRFMHRHDCYLPVVNENGDVTGKISAMIALGKKTEYMIPVVRIALAYNNMLYLCPCNRPAENEKGKTDLPVADFLLYKETLEQRIRFMMKENYPQLPLDNGITYIGKKRCETNHTAQLNYLFLFRTDNEEYLTANRAKQQGKLWTFQQIEQNLHKNFFSPLFEAEYEALKSAILHPESKQEEKII